jgi:hypothetical protein
MTKTTILTTVLLLASGGVAGAGGQNGSIGVGIESQIPGLDNPTTTTDALSVNYDAGMFHVGGFLGVADPEGPNNTFFTIGARFFYHVHKTAMSDFGIGGSLGLSSVPVNDPMDPNHHYNTDVFLAPSFQVRAFITSNVALSFTGGFVIGVVDASGFSLGGGLEGLAGVHYYFF